MYIIQIFHYSRFPPKNGTKSGTWNANPHGLGEHHIPLFQLR